MSADFYFSKWEMRRPPPPQAWSRKQEFWWQALAVAAGVLGIWYLAWRWSASLNPDAFWLSVPVVVAETLCYVGLLLFFHNIWQVRDTPQQAPPSSRDVCIPGGDSRLLSVDIFITTYNEDPELVRLSIIDAKRVRYPVPIDLKVFVLDDGRRAEMA
ncbi:MAG: cellulose synthase, partial [Pseudomonadota bacterium]